MSLTPERPLLISPTLAATIGLEEAVLFHLITELLQVLPCHERDGRRWVSLADEALLRQVPFWQAADLRRLTNRLVEMGMLLREADPARSGTSHYALNEGGNTANAARVTRLPPEHSTPPGEDPKPFPGVGSRDRASPIDPQWQPDPDWLAQCRQHGIPDAFSRSRVPEFVQYWLDRGTAEFSWGNKFYKFVLREWRHEQTRQGAFERAQPMGPQWAPSEDALMILTHAGINREFIDDAVPEFVLYWRERGESQGAWNTRFIEHVRRQWTRYRATIGIDDVPRPIPVSWQPSPECYDILALAEIDPVFARGKVPEFVLYWRDSGQVRASWNTVFLQFIKQEWAQRLQTFGPDDSDADNRSRVADGQRRLEARLQRLADRSWAD